MIDWNVMKSVMQNALLALGCLCSCGADLLGSQDALESEASIEVVFDRQPELELLFDTQDGIIGTGTDEVTLTANDEPVKYRNESGFQIDVIVNAKYLENGIEIALFVDGEEWLGGGGDPRKDGQKRFKSVTLATQPGTVPVTVKAVNAAGLTAEATKSVSILDIHE